MSDNRVGLEWAYHEIESARGHCTMWAYDYSDVADDWDHACEYAQWFVTTFDPDDRDTPSHTRAWPMFLESRSDADS